MPATSVVSLAATGFPANRPISLLCRARSGPEARDRSRLAGPSRLLMADEDLLLEGEAPSGCHVVLEGMLYRYKMLHDGKRQILAFLLPGEHFGLSAVLLGQCDHSVAALVSSRVGTIPASRWNVVPAIAPDTVPLPWQHMLIQDSIAREWIANIGRRRACERIAHLLCEMRARFEVAPIDGKARFGWRISQAVLGDATSLSVVHVNRVLQQLRADNLVTMNDGIVEIGNLQKLEEFAGFNDAYLNLGRASARQTCLGQSRQ